MVIVVSPLNLPNSPPPNGVTFIIVARNSGSVIAPLIGDLIAQDFPRSDLEVIVVDGCSTDGTADIAERLLTGSGIAFRILSNPARILPSGWNIALASAQRDIILRVDSHARIQPDFVRRNYEAHARGEFITGGPVISMAQEGASKFALALESSRFGGGAADFRNVLPQSDYVDTLGFAAYRREIFLAIGGYDERLVRNQDNEIHARMRHAGYRFRYEPTIRSTRWVRPRFRALLRQKFLTGYWIPLTAVVRPSAFSARHWAPLMFVLFLAAAAACFGIGQIGWPLFTMLGCYLVPAVLFSAKAANSTSGPGLVGSVFLPFGFFALHISYGIGTLAGTLAAPSFAWRTRRYSNPYPAGKNQESSQGRRQGEDLTGHA